ncbi:hypothetical protein [Streptomyces sp. BR123]|nr:hypothetical protein [Streptomyces sp. BR123]
MTEYRPSDSVADSEVMVLPGSWHSDMIAFVRADPDSRVGM